MGTLGALLGRLYRRIHDKLYWELPRASQGVSLGTGVYVAPGCVFGARETVIGDHTRINGPIWIVGSEKVTIGKYCAFGAHITVITTNHAMHYANLQIALQRRCGFASLVADTKPTVIGHNVWVGDRAVILPGVQVGDGAVIGAASVVTRDVPPFAIVAGSPARVLRKRFDENVIRELLDIRWWDWPARGSRRIAPSSRRTCAAFRAAN